MAEVFGNHIDLFLQYLKEEVQIYVNSFGKPRKEKKLIRDRLIFIEETYSELIYFGEFNSVKARKEEFENRTEEEKEIDKQRGYFGGIVCKIEFFLYIYSCIKTRKTIF